MNWIVFDFIDFEIAIQSNLINAESCDPLEINNLIC